MLVNKMSANRDTRGAPSFEFRPTVKPPTKTLVVGSSGHEHVTCVDWPGLTSVNLKDFDAVVVNVASLDDSTIKSLPEYGFFKDVRTELSHLLDSGGTIVVLTPERRTIKHKDDGRTNWEWCPIIVGTSSEAGDTVEIRRPVFERYLSKLKRWTFYFFVPQSCLTRQLTDVFGSPADYTYRLDADAYAVNRYGKMLAGEVPLLITTHDGLVSKYGSIILLPMIPDLEQKEAVNLILEDLIAKPQRSLPPDWVDQIPMPFVDEIDAEIAQRQTAIDSLRQQIIASQKRRDEIEKWKKLVYATGHELEEIFEEAVILLGAKTKPAAAEEEFTFEHKGKTGVVECKGVTKSISLDHVRQTDSHVLNLDSEECGAKGILFGNAFRQLPLAERDKSDTRVFPDNVVKRAAQREIALVDASAFLVVFCRFLKNELSGEAILDAMMEQSGIVDFQKVKR